MSWRRIVVDGVTYRWTASVSVSTRMPGDLAELRVIVIGRTEDRAAPRKVTATFRGFAVEHLFTGRQQNVAVRPATVAAILRDGRAVIEHAEREFPAAITSADPTDAVFAAACEQWFVPYPGRERLAAALAELAGDQAAVAARFGVTPAQVARWADELGLTSRT